MATDPDRASAQRRSDVSSTRKVIVVSLALGLLVLGVAGCSSSGHDTTPEKVPLERLAHNQDHYSGDLVVTTGTVRRFGHGSGTHYVVEDTNHNRVEIRPASKVADRVGEVVTVTGAFSFDDTSGRTLEATSVRPAT